MKLAVVIATYNRKSTILQAIYSVLDIEVPLGWSVEIIVVDDGSSDQTYSFLKESEVGSRISILQQANAERGAARNFGAHYAQEHFRPDWLLFLDSDDQLSTNGLIRTSQKIALIPIQDTALIYGWCSNWDGNESPTKWPQKFETMPSGDIAEFCLESTFVPLGATLIASRFFFDLGGFSEDRRLSGSEDKILITRLAFAGKAEFCPGVIAWYRQHPSNTDPSQMLRSIDLSRYVIDQEIDKKFVSRAKKLKIKFDFHCFIKKIGHAVYLRRRGLAMQIFFEQISFRPMTVFSMKTWRIVLICFISLFK